MNNGYLRWMYVGFKKSLKCDTVKGIIFLFFGLAVSFSLAYLFVFLTKSVYLFFVTIFCGMFFTGTYSIYLMER